MSDWPTIGGDRRKPGPLADRMLMRIKDAIIIGTAAIALVKWFYVNPLQVQEKVTRQESILIQQQKTMDKQQQTMEKIANQLDTLNERFREFQRSFYSKKPGGWVYEDDQWKYSTHEKR